MWRRQSPLKTIMDAEQLHHRHQALVGAVADLALPLAADGEHLAVEVADGFAVLVDQRVVAAEIDEGALQPVELRRALAVDDEEREVLGHERPLVGRALQVDDVVVVVGVDRVGHHRQAARADGLLQRAADHRGPWWRAS